MEKDTNSDWASTNEIMKTFDRSEQAKQGDVRLFRDGVSRRYQLNIGWFDSKGACITHARACEGDWWDSQQKIEMSGYMTLEDVEKMNQQMEDFWLKLEQEYKEGRMKR